MNQSFRGQLVDLDRDQIRPVEVNIEDGRIASIRDLPDSSDCPTYLLPGFVDAHIHIESSMLTVGEFARAAVIHGTVATVSDPHEIANVLGESGIQFMTAAAAEVPLKVFFGIPSCVPATPFETAGARLDSQDVARLLREPQFLYLSEMMNYPGVLSGDPEVHAKLSSAMALGKPVDGHAPGLRGPAVVDYIGAGISTDHECTAYEEAAEKIAAGCKIQIRQGSAARNFDALYRLIDEFPNAVMFCSDDKHPDDLLVGHINDLVRESIARGQSLFNVLRCACQNPVDHYGLPVGQLRKGDPADWIEVADLTNFRVLRTMIDGHWVAVGGEPQFAAPTVTPMNVFRATKKQPSDFALPQTGPSMRVIEAVDGELITRSTVEPVLHLAASDFVPDLQRDLLKLTVVNRYQDAVPSVAVIRNFGLTRGAIASSVAHDCHNLVAVGTTNEDLATVINLLVDTQGGLALVDGDTSLVLPLPVAGLMSLGTCREVAEEYGRLNQAAMAMGTTLRAPFMTLSFMALLVIPSLKLSDRGLFDGDSFTFTSPFAPPK